MLHNDSMTALAAAMFIQWCIVPFDKSSAIQQGQKEIIVPHDTWTCNCTALYQAENMGNLIVDLENTGEKQS